MLEAPHGLRSKKIAALSSVCAFIIAVQTGTKQALADSLSDSSSHEVVDPQMARILALEQKFFEFAESLLAAMETSNLDQDIKDKIKNAIERFKKNTKNTGRFQSPGLVSLGSEMGFSYQFSNHTIYSARFRGLSRTMILAENFDPSDIGDALFFLHELIHVEQDDKRRVQIPWERYVKFWQTNGNLCIAEDEADAMVIELEALEALEGGETRQAKRPGASATFERYSRPYNKGGKKALERALQQMCRETRDSKMFTPDLRPL